MKLKLNLNLNFKDTLAKLRRKAPAPALAPLAMPEEAAPKRDPSVIVEVGGKRLVFGMEWKVLLGEGDVHRDARKVQAPYLWTADKAPFVGFLHRADRKQRLKQPLYSGAIALLNRFPDVPNVLFISTVEDLGFIICGFHQRRPKDGFDIFLPMQRKAKIGEILTNFGKVCGDQRFELYGDVAAITNIKIVSRDELVDSANASCELRRVQSALVNPAVAGMTFAVVAIAAWYGYHAFTKYRDAERQRKAMASQKNSQQLYMEELTARRGEPALPARAMLQALAPIGAMAASLGGWALNHVECTVATEKQLSCAFKYSRSAASSATNQSFAAATKGMFDSVTYGQAQIATTKAFKLADFVTRGVVIDAAKSQADEDLEFGSDLQRCSRIGKANILPYQPYAIPSGANVAELTSPPVGSAAWDWNGPFRAMKALGEFPAYVTVTKIVVDFTLKPSYDMHQSMAMVTVSGDVFSKPN